MNFLYFIISIFVFFQCFLFIKFNSNLKIREYSQIQNIHHGDISRMGGLAIYIATFFSAYLLNESKLINLLILSLIIIIPALLEDMRIQVNAYIRFVLILATSLILVMNIELPVFNFNFFNEFFNNNFFKLLFFTLALSTIINGQNMIDGANGLSGLSALVSFFCIFFLGLLLDDSELINISLIFIFSLIGFLILNYPFGKIFLGDAGSYLIGFVIGALVIFIYGKYKDLPTWTAVIIVSYPTIEVIFSYFRKIFSGKSPFEADDKHLHLIIYKILNTKGNGGVLSNSLVTVFLTIIWIFPVAVLPLALELSKYFSLLIIFSSILFYILLYYGCLKTLKSFYKED